MPEARRPSSQASSCETAHAAMSRTQWHTRCGPRTLALWMTTLHRLPEEWTGLEVWACKLPVRVIYIFI